MLINKRSYKGILKPLRQDVAYWIKTPDKLAVSFWITIDYTIKKNGCMWLIQIKK
jgi:ectoine hydroxylase-related dioxygenase (phytanoyl-CoA dioxygenase family)